MQSESLDRRRTSDDWTKLKNAMFEWTEVFADRQRPHLTLDDETPADYGRDHPTARDIAVWQPNPRCLPNGGSTCPNAGLGLRKQKS
jgi:hypothetical protein